MAVALRGELNSDEDIPGGCRGVECFEKLKLLGQGTYGEVHKAIDKRTGDIVALKKLKLVKENYDKEGFPLTAIREIKILNKFRHENIINLKEVVTSRENICMVFEYMDHDLTGLANREKFSVPQMKCYMTQLLKGIHYCHANGVLHRDIKSSNLLINNEGSLKLADFGLARNFCAKDHDQDAQLTSQVVTLWYRPPELFLGATKYGPSVDMWSAGCVFAELLCQGRPVFNGHTEPDVMKKIVEVCGTPDEANWPGVTKLPLYNTFCKAKTQQKPLSQIFRHCDRHALELLEKLLTLDPSKRISAKDALDADYFWTDPLPCDPKILPKYYKSSHELDIRNDDMKKRKQQQQLQDEKHLVIGQKPLECQQRHELDIRNDDMKMLKQQQQLQDEEHVVKGQKPVEYQQRHELRIRNEHDDMKKRKLQQQQLQDEDHVVKRQKPVEYQQRPELDIRNDHHDIEKRKQQQLQLQDEENVAKRHRQVEYQQRPPRSFTPPRHQLSEKAEGREQQPYRDRPNYRTQPPVSAWPRHRYERRPPRPSYGARRYYQNDRYASARDSYIRDDRRNRRY